MGQNQSQSTSVKSKSRDSAPPPTANGNGSRKIISRTPSAASINDRPLNLMPIDKLSKILSSKSQAQEGVNGITLKVFTQNLFPRYPLFAEKLFAYFLRLAKSKNAYLSNSGFKQQAERFLAVLEDDKVHHILVQMFAGSDENVTRDDMYSLFMSTYHVSMDHYSEGPQMCVAINKTLTAVIESCFLKKTSLSCQYVVHWIEENCPRLLLTLHRYAVHSLATSYRTLETHETDLAAGLELATPVLEQPPLFKDGEYHPHLLQMSMSWLLAGALPPLYSRPQRANSPSNSGVGLSSQAFLMKLLCAVPSHWISLYDSEENGIGSNRFLHHVLAYKGATLCLLKVDGGSIFCIGSPNEWKESHLYWGGEDAILFQILPTFRMLERGSKSLYLNLSIRGYPQGLRVGKDPREPIISINSGFDKLEYRKIPYSLDRVEVWGCGDQASRDAQLDVKKWEVKEAERQRNVKLSAADWLDHPDRYLLELAGRPQYNNQNPPL
ncbi:hypothetical protein PPYR_03225 [Photinus pyralis]|uniref:TLDc domain-containing protein n=1 Tax=Photinus pyralis TaxID=7054 RepID=A0A1Y1NHJ1_PHOPY|nr:uncharacterized protein LOC116161563 isoform X2 [Photinus pyralis]KAB0791425.1 hypothetical protein PPYR_03225 [Photinus pyralis]